MLPANPLLNATAPAGPHLPVALLRQYAAGTLAPAAQHRVEAHTLACSRCADALEGLLQTPAATTDQALAQLQQRLRKRVQQQAAPARQATSKQPHRWLAPQLAAAATLILGLVAGGWWTWQQRHPATVGPAPVAEVRPAPPASLAAPSAAPAASAAAPTPPLPPQPPMPAARPMARTGHQHRRAGSSQPHAAPATAAAPLAAGTPSPVAADAPAATTAALTPPDTAGLASKAAVATAAKLAIAPEAARVRAGAMPAMPALAPAPVGGYTALRDKLRRAAAEFVPEAPDRPLSGTVRLQLTIGPDGKIQKINVLRGLRDDYDAEAQRLVCDGPAWVPGVSGGRRAAQAVEIAVPF
ncbi:hypothetical protein GO988_07205 [Hymenobacter sp. HMF4947]|uniref:TonB C-terminal domain-containing protein n=1 Tax=Hymenobacter ginkgonis TaxID=2682976 RepID=A0A7K1TCI0_9BACT|nr:energy transducer TonB [Hymenobacter ginkgonis]MVN76108.1 hypothetical protein [Hymenobacter ginkgonis]